MKQIFKEKFFLLLLFVAMTTTSFAQRATDNLNRGLVAVVPKSGSGVFLSWRIQADEYYDVTYNLYRDGVKIASDLNVSNYMDASGSTSRTYTVKAVVNGIEENTTPTLANGMQAKVFSTSPSKNANGAPGYFSIPMQDVFDRNGERIFCCCGQHKDTYTYYTIKEEIKGIVNGKEVTVDATFNTNTETRNVCLQEFVLNDVCLADLDGDGEMEFIVKRINETDASTHWPKYTGSEQYSGSLYLGAAKDMYALDANAYTIIEAYKLDGTRLWWIDCGPNMVSMNSVEINCVAYDWDEDGCAEVILRGADNMIIHPGNESATSNDRTKGVSSYTIGGSNVNTRGDLVSHSESQYAWTHTGNEYLLYLNGKTGELYQMRDFPLKRLEDGENETDAWYTPAEYGKRDGVVYRKEAYGHRSSKYFFGAPYLDGKKPSIFLGRGIYTQIKMTVFDVDKNSHTLTERLGWPWKRTWNNYSADDPWYGQGYHNFSIADVDGDGCDEIIYGSMVIDNNGKGLSTTGLGHGDAHHVGDLDPFRKGQEIFACNEDEPSNNYRDATTSEIIYRGEHLGGWDSSKNEWRDDGRALMGNFTNDVPGCVGRSWQSALVSATTGDYAPIGDLNLKTSASLNGRIYWDGDLLEEYYDSPGTERDCTIMKFGGNRIMDTYGCKMNNDSKNNPCAQGDILGDWREEIILRNEANTELRIYSTDVPTTWRIPSLWYDHQYRQGMVTWVCGYNQSPHASFYIGEMEGYTRAPLPLTNAGRTKLSNNSVITGTEHNDKVLLLCNDNGSNAAFGVERDGDDSKTVYPSMIIVNASSKVSGNDNNNNISYSYNRIELGAKINDVDCTGKLGGSMRLIKQGDGLLILSNRTHSYTGDTEIWEGALSFKGTIDMSNIWMNRHTTFYLGGEVKTSLTMEYGATLSPAKDVTNIPYTTANYTTAKVTGTLNMHEGSRIVLEYDTEEKHDNMEIGTLNIRKRTEDNWKQYGPKYLAPVFEIKPKSKLEAGRYKLGTITNITGGTIDDIIIECNNTVDNAIIYLEKDETTNEVFMVIDEGVDPNKSHTETVTEHNIVTRTYNLDFEETADNIYTETIDGQDVKTTEKYGFVKEGSIALMETYQKVAYSGGNVFHGYAPGNGNRAIRKSFSNLFDGIVTAGTTTYTFSFDMALVQNQKNADSKVYVFSGASEELFTITFNINSTDGAIKDANGQLLSNINIAPHVGSSKPGTTISDKYLPGDEYYYTYTITGNYANDRGNVKLTVKNKKDETIILLDNVEICSSFKTIDRILCNLNKAYGHVVFDNFNLNASSDATITTTTTTNWTEVDLSESVAPKIPAGTYDILNVTRGKFKKGYNTFCFPMNTTPAEIIAPSETAIKAYTFSKVVERNSTIQLGFTEVDAIEANKPYLIYVDDDVDIPTRFNDVTLAVARPISVNVGDWKFVSNYEGKKSMEGNYMIYNDNDGGALRFCGAKTYLRGMRAYIIGPSNTKALKMAIGDIDDEPTIIFEQENNKTDDVSAIYSVSGMKLKSLGKGVNIVRSKNGNVRKVYVK